MDFCIPYSFLVTLAIIGWPGVLYDALFGSTLSSLGNTLLGIVVNVAIFSSCGLLLDHRRKVSKIRFWKRAAFYYPAALLSIALLGYIGGIIEAYFTCS